MPPFKSKYFLFFIVEKKAYAEIIKAAFMKIYQKYANW